MDDDVKKYLEQVKKKTIKSINPDRIILFGSYARGDYDDDSDVDLVFFIVDKERKDFRDIKHKIDSILQNRQLPTDILVCSTDKFKDEEDIIGTFPHVISKEGELIYDKGYC